MRPNKTPINKEKLASKQKQFKLRKSIIQFRERYLTLAKEYQFRHDFIETDEQDRRERYLKIEEQKYVYKRRYIYYVESDLDWIESLLAEHKKLSIAVQNHKADKNNETLPQKFWLPPVLENVRFTQVKKYPAHTVKDEIAYDDLKDADRKKFKSSMETTFKLSIRSGTQYRLVVASNTNARVTIPFPDWMICICESKIKPKIYDRDEKNPPIPKSRITITPNN